ncbi:MAG: anti-sigma factor family protein [Phycisphaerae bacterium]
MRCDQAQQLFDAYLDGELSPSLQRELGAHRVACADCRRELALLEVAGQLISTDDEPVGLQDGFTDRLMACVDEGHHRDTRWRRILYVGAPMAAAAVVCLAFLGLFDPAGRDTRVAGVKVQNIDDQRATLPAGTVETDTETNADASNNVAKQAVMGVSDVYEAKGGIETKQHGDPNTDASGSAPGAPTATGYDRIVDDIRSNVNNKQHHVRSLRDSLDLTIQQWLDMLNADKEQAKDTHGESSNAEHDNNPNADRKGDIEDL